GMKGGWFGVLGGAALLLSAGCHLLQMTPGGGTKPPERELIAGAPGKYSQRVAPYVFLADFELQRNAPLFRELANLRDQISRDLKLPAGNIPIYVYLFEDKARYERFMQAKYPELPTRRAFFVAQPRRLGGSEELMVFTYRGERREAWAWVHFMLLGQPQAKQVLLQYLHELRTNSRPGPLEPRLSAALLSPHEALDRHLAELDGTRRPATAQK